MPVQTYKIRKQELDDAFGEFPTFFIPPLIIGRTPAFAKLSPSVRLLVWFTLANGARLIVDAWLLMRVPAVNLTGSSLCYWNTKVGLVWCTLANGARLVVDAGASGEPDGVVPLLLGQHQGRPQPRLPHLVR